MYYEEVVYDPVTQSDDDLIPCLKSLNNLKMDTITEESTLEFKFDPSEYN